METSEKILPTSTLTSFFIEGYKINEPTRLYHAASSLIIGYLRGVPLMFPKSSLNFPKRNRISWSRESRSFVDDSDSPKNRGFSTGKPRQSDLTLRRSFRGTPGGCGGFLWDGANFGAVSLNIPWSEIVVGFRSKTVGSEGLNLTQFGFNLAGHTSE